MPPGLPVRPTTSPVAIPSSIHQLLGSIRSQVFQTNYNPTAQRQGTKFIRRRLVGQQKLKYYPKPLWRPSIMNESDKRAMYPGWTGIVPGIPQASQSAPIAESSTSSPSPSTSTSASSADAAPQPSPSPSSSTSTPTPSSSLNSPGTIAALKEAGINPQSMFFGSDNWFGVTPPVEAWPTQWQADARERARLTKLEKRRRIGKVTPKKGQGKRSQLGKKR